MLLSPFPTYVKDKFNPSDFTVSLVISVFAFAAIISRFVTASLMRNHKRNLPMMFTGLALASVATAIYPFASSVAVLLVLRVLFGIGFGMASTIMPTIVAKIIPGNRMGEGIGYFGMSTTLAMSVGPIIGLSVLDGFGFGTLAAMGTAAGIISMPLAHIAAGRRKLPAANAASVRTAPSSPGAAPKPKSPFNKKLLLPCALNVLLSLTYGGLLSFLALYGKEKHIGSIALFFLFNALAAFIVRPISGRLFDSKGHIAVIVPGAVFSFIGLILISYTSSLPLLILSGLFYGIGYGAIQPTLQAWMLQISQPHEHGTANGLYYNALDFGVAIGSMLLGVIASATSYGMMYRFSSLSMVLFVVIYIITLAAVRRKRQHNVQLQQMS
ncbi:MFS transporter [Paenibacillus protaetiae]|uniref:MFS transporter n=2 Tax=Paenibacillus protaetiae TaxID=2509456 RepID=A0A4P6EYA4_9BACL|nr:MFS transporter [Paenibacillus protaetiae]